MNASFKMLRTNIDLQYMYDPFGLFAAYVRRITAIHNEDFSLVIFVTSLKLLNA